MTEILGFDKLEKITPKISFCAFRILKSLTIENLNGYPKLECYITTTQENPNIGIRLLFEGISELKIADLGEPEFRIDGFDIINIADRKWENIVWEAVDYEDDRIHWYAKKVELLSAVKI